MKARVDLEQRIAGTSLKYVQIEVPLQRGKTTYVGAILGPRGAFIQQIQKASGTKMIVKVWHDCCCSSQVD
jgi:NADPH-dependent curcumin reductase CurA